MGALTDIFLLLIKAVLSNFPVCEHHLEELFQQTAGLSQRF